MPENHVPNHLNNTSCYTCVAACPYCSCGSKKYGFTQSGKQRFRCRRCFKTFLYSYTKKFLSNTIDNEVVVLLKEGCGIRSISRVLRVSAVTIIRKIKAIAMAIEMPAIVSGQAFQVDELYTFVSNKNNPVWVIYAINNADKRVAAFNVGSRSNKDISLVTNELISCFAQRIYTDKLLNYRSLIPKEVHSTQSKGTNHIERKNLTLRTHLKRLSRKTICFSKSIAMLFACLKIYFWG